MIQISCLPSRILRYLSLASVSFAILVQPAFPDPDSPQANNHPHYGSPLHPSALFVVNKGNQLPVVGAKGDKLLILDNGKQRAVSSTRSDVVFERAESFSNGYIQLEEGEAKNSRFSTVTTDGVKIAGGLTSGSSDQSFSIDYTADRDIENAYIVLLLTKNIIGPDKHLYIDQIVFVKDIGTMEKDVEKRVKVSLSKLHWLDLETRSIVPMFFSDGEELLTSRSNQSAAHFQRLKATAHRGRLEKHLLSNASRDSNPILYSSFNPIATHSGNLSEYPDSIPAIVSIDANGRISDFKLEDVFASFVMDDLRRDFNGWFFLPRIENGSPVDSKAKVEITFSK